MAALSFSTNWPTFQQRHQDYNAVLPPPPDILTLQDNFYTLSDHTSINPLLLESSNHHFTSFNNGVTTTNLSFHNTLKYPTLSSSFYNSPITIQQQILPMTTLPEIIDLSSFTHDHYPYPYSYPYSYSYPLGPNVCPMDDQQLMPELPPLPEICEGGGCDSVMIPFEGEDRSSGVIDVRKEDGNGGERLSAQSMAARVRRRRISEKTLELGKLVPGGHRMNTAEMFQAAFKYVKFLQAQVGVLQLMGSSPELEPNGELVNALVTSRSVQEKLYGAEKCIVTQTLRKSLSRLNDLNC